MERETATAECLSEMAEMYGRELDASEVALVRFGFAYGASWASHRSAEIVSRQIDRVEELTNTP